MRRSATIVAAVALVLLSACGNDGAPQAPSTGGASSAPVADTDSPFPGRQDSFDTEDPNSLCFGASPDIPSPYEGCPGYSPEQESVAKTLPPSPPAASDVPTDVVPTNQPPGPDSRGEIAPPE